MRSFLLISAVVAFAALAPTAHSAPKVDTPYTTVVEAGETYVRSGPGTTFYPTGKLRRGDKVVVHRHDPGDWHMIAPPAGSFSWVPAKYVNKTAADRGTVKTNKVAARVGSFESDIHEVWQRPLAEGDEIRILGEKMLTPEAGNGPAELWYRIEPPKGEWRWVRGQDLAPAQQAGAGTTAGDPFVSAGEPPRRKRSTPPVARADDDSPPFEAPLTDSTNREYTDDSTREAPLANRPLVRKEGKPGKTKLPPRKQDGILDELDRLDARFRSILDKPPLEWDFGQLEHDYQVLRGEAESSNIQQMIDTRIDKIASYRKVRGEEEELTRIQNETARRDAELAEIQRRQEAQLASLRQPRFDGAGIVQRSALTRHGSPRYALVATTGRVLAYLAPAPGVNLEAWIGRPAGVTGSRVPSPELRADLITVNRLTPVRLVP